MNTTPIDVLIIFAIIAGFWVTGAMLVWWVVKIIIRAITHEVKEEWNEKDPK